jgi:hypothetical protein
MNGVSCSVEAALLKCSSGLNGIRKMWDYAKNANVNFARLSPGAISDNTPLGCTNEAFFASRFGSIMNFSLD